MSGHWAELPVIHDTESGIAAIEREQMTKPRPLEIEEPALYQPSNPHQAPSNESYLSSGFATDGTTLYTIKLLQYCDRLNSLIQNAKQQIESVKSGEIKASNFSPVPQLPTLPESIPTHRLPKPIPFLEKDLNGSFVCGNGSLPPEVNQVTCRRLLRRAVATLCAHAGFECSSESCIDVLVDVTSDYFIRMTQLINADISCQIFNGQHSEGFSEVITQVFYEMGIGNPQVLHEFYQSRVIDRQARLVALCQQLQAEYSNLVQSDSDRTASGSSSTVWKESSAGDIQFPVTADDDEAGFSDQMLALENFEGNNAQESDTLTAVDEESGANVGFGGTVAGLTSRSTRQ